jgi:hypothetical protein
MEVTSVAAAMVGAQAADAQMTLAAKMLRMNADAAGAVADMLDKAQQNLQSPSSSSLSSSSLANVAAGVGQNLNISA